MMAHAKRIVAKRCKRIRRVGEQTEKRAMITYIFLHDFFPSFASSNPAEGLPVFHYFWRAHDVNVFKFKSISSLGGAAEEMQQACRKRSEIPDRAHSC